MVEQWFHETRASAAARAAEACADAAPADAAHLALKRKGHFETRWPLRGADQAGYEAFMCSSFC